MEYSLFANYGMKQRVIRLVVFRKSLYEDVYGVSSFLR